MIFSGTVVIYNYDESVTPATRIFNLGLSPTQHAVNNIVVVVEAQKAYEGLNKSRQKYKNKKPK